MCVCSSLPQEGRIQDFTSETELLKSSELARTEFALRMSVRAYAHYRECVCVCVCACARAARSPN